MDRKSADRPKRYVSGEFLQEAGDVRLMSLQLVTGLFPDIHRFDYCRAQGDLIMHLDDHLRSQSEAHGLSDQEYGCFIALEYSYRFITVFLIDLQYFLIIFIKSKQLMSLYGI